MNNIKHKLFMPNSYRKTKDDALSKTSTKWRFSTYHLPTVSSMIQNIQIKKEKFNLFQSKLRFPP